MAIYPDVLPGVGSVNISTPFDWSTNQLVLKTQFANGTESRRLVWGAPRRKFTLNYNNTSKEGFDTIYTFYKARNGPFESFDFEVPHASPSETVKVRFNEEGIQISDTKSLYISFTVELVELI